MKIHTCKEGERLSHIAEIYGVSEENIIMSNIPGCENAAVGEELLILTPTRTYKLKEGDSLERLSLRFGVKPSDIIAANPWLIKDGISSGRTVNLKFDDKIYGSAPANGYLYEGTGRDRFLAALPYLTYVTVCAGIYDARGLHFSFHDGGIVMEIIKQNKIPLLRIYDRCKTRNYKDRTAADAYINSIISAATSHGYLGVVLSAESGGDFDDFGEFLLLMRKSMIGSDLILLLEIDEDTPSEISELADGNIFFYPRCASDLERSFEECERYVYSKFATEGESAKCFIDICALAKLGEGFIGIEEAVMRARGAKTEILRNGKSLICEFKDKNKGRCIFSSMKSVKSALDIIEEFGFMGANFDIGRTPISHFLMYNMHFKTAVHTYRRAKEGCSKD